MGEAKRRKLSEEFYGRVPKKGKGLIISTPLKISGENVTVSGALDPTELRRAVLFWDRLVWPRNPSFAFSDTPETLYLKGAGLLECPQRSASGALGVGLKKMFEDEFFVREQDESGQWAMSTGENALQLGSDRFQIGRGATVELYRSVPIPSRDVPLEDILEFKNKRKSEVVEFTIAVDKFYSSWTNSEDQDFQLNLAKQEIEKRCSDLIKTTKEAKFPFIPSSWSVSYSLNTGTAAAIAALVASHSSGLPMVESSLIALAAGFGMDFAFGPKKERGSMSPFRYAASIEKDMF